MILLAPQFLFGLIALAVPVIIHFVQLRRPKKVYFTNVGFIKKVEKVNASQRKLKHWLILLSRVLFLSFLVLLFCQPFIPAKTNSLSKLSEVAFYIDNSMSMQNNAETGNHSLLDQATGEVLKIIPELPNHLNIRLLDNSFKAASNRTLTKENIPQTLGNLIYSPISRTTDNIFNRLNSNSPLKTTYFFSDFQKEFFEPDYLNKLDTASSINLIVIKADKKDNVYIDSVALLDELLRPNENNRLNVKVINKGQEIKNGLNLKLFIGNQLASTISLNLKPNSGTAVDIDFRVSQRGILPCRLEIEDQPVIFDNTFYFTIKTAGTIKILDIATSSNINTSKLFINEPLFKYQQVSPGNINYNQLSSADLVLVNEIENLDAALIDNLKKFVANGGKLAFVPSEKLKANNYAVFFQTFGLPISQLATISAPSALAKPDLKNPFFRNIFSQLDNRMEMPAVPQSLNLTRPELEILKYRNGNNFLSRYRLGKGDIFVFAAPLSSENNEFSRNALFVPVMYKLALSSYQNEQQLSYNFNQRTFSLPVPKTDLRKTVFTLENDSVKYIPEQKLRDGKMVFTLPAEMAQAGFYNLKHNDSTLATLAFNYPKKESNLETYSAEELRSLITNPKVKVFESGANADFAAEVVKDTKGIPLWHYCIIFCLFFLLTEILLIRFL
jgi:hypothetical protein